MSDQIFKPWKEEALNKAIMKVFNIVGLNPDAKTPRVQGFKDFFIAGWNAAVEQIKAEAATDFRMDELDAVMTSVDKWLKGDELKNNPATRAADAREIALKAIEAEAKRAEATLRDVWTKLYDLRGEPDKLNAIIMREHAAIIGGNDGPEPV